MLPVSPGVVVEWGDRVRAEVATAAELDEALAQAEAEARDQGAPQAVELAGVGDAGRLSVVVGSDRSFVSHVPADGDPPYFASVGDEDEDRPFTFYVYGHHHTEVAWRNTVAPEEAFAAARHFVETGELDARLRWEET